MSPESSDGRQEQLPQRTTGVRPAAVEGGAAHRSGVLGSAGDDRGHVEAVAAASTAPPVQPWAIAAPTGARPSKIMA
ncbi:hypothetical protein [Streptomyces sp. WI03-4A]|uniref:hypothetical protein n=1 Tax=Streptomyces sp. WI03-4A TaxID=3028706 RepID=UPI0029C02A45|nr:hypothetical protein [Streptomyces sp. WI03-4A]